MWANVLDLDNKMSAELISIEEKRANLVAEMLPKDSDGKAEYQGRVCEQIFDGVPLKQLVAVWCYD